MPAYRVIAPYVTLKVTDTNGQPVVMGYYRDGIVHDPVPGEVLDKHLRQGLIEKWTAAKPEATPTPDTSRKAPGRRRKAPAKDSADEDRTTDTDDDVPPDDEDDATDTSP